MKSLKGSRYSMRVTGSEENLPDAAGVLSALSRIGYSIEAALADLVDNSIDANAKNVLIGFIKEDGAVTRAVVADDGHGMTGAELQRAMTFGRGGDHTSLDLGRYGMGLKSASFSQSRALTVVSRKQEGRIAARRWTVDGVRSGWNCDVINADDAERFLVGQEWRPIDRDSVATVVIWDDLEEFRVASSYLDTRVKDVFQRLAIWLGTVFHRFLQAGRLNINLRLIGEGNALGLPVLSQNPFGYPFSGALGYPKDFDVPVKGLGDVRLRTHVLPRSPQADWYRLGTRGEVANLQGLYFYRNDRLIQRGGWNGFRAESEPHFSLARGELDLDSRYDEAFSLNVQKSGLEMPPSFLDGLEVAAASDGTTVRDWIRSAEHVYRGGRKSREQRTLTPASGLTKRVLRGLPDDGDTESIQIDWAEMDNSRIVDVDLDHRRILLNREWRHVILEGRPASTGDAPMFKLLLFLALEDELRRVNRTRQLEERLERIDAYLRAVLETRK